MKHYIKHHPWKIIEDGFHPDLQRVSESLFSLGNGRMGQRANFAETYSGDTLPGNYLAGIYYPDKTRVGWWKNGYPEYFAKVLNAPNWLSLHIAVDGTAIDLAIWEVQKFTRVLNMEDGILERTCTIRNSSGIKLKIQSRRLCHLQHKNLGLLEYAITILEGSPTIEFTSSIEGDVYNEDANYGEQFWEEYDAKFADNIGILGASTKKTAFRVVLAMNNTLTLNNRSVGDSSCLTSDKNVGEQWKMNCHQQDEIVLKKIVTVVSNFYYPEEELVQHGMDQLNTYKQIDFNELVREHRQSWAEKWSETDIRIVGDEGAQQGIRFNIFQLLQTYTGEDTRLNIGPKGFTGEKYGGSTYWDTEAYCLPFYLATSPPQVAKNLLLYRYKHLDKAIENASKLGFSGGAALFPMVTMTGEECHNEWEITFEEIHRNGAIAYAIYDYIRYTGDHQYLLEGGLEVLIAIARFWAQRVHFAVPKDSYVMHGVTGPNEYENNVNNNWYTNYMAKWCLEYTVEEIQKWEEKSGEVKTLIRDQLRVSDEEIQRWSIVANQMYLPEDKQQNIFLQQEGFLDKEIINVDQIPIEQRPINQHWSWDRILRSCFIKQADVLQGLYFFEDHFAPETLQRNFEFYEPLTVHESSLSPCVHAILACRIGHYDKAYEMYLRTARLDLEDYNNDTEDGCHITSMAGTWLAIVEGFAGMRVSEEGLHFDPHCPKQWSNYHFSIHFRNRKLDLLIDHEKMQIFNHGKDLNILVDHTIQLLKEASVTSIVIHQTTDHP